MVASAALARMRAIVSELLYVGCYRLQNMKDDTGAIIHFMYGRAWRFEINLADYISKIQGYGKRETYTATYDSLREIAQSSLASVQIHCFFNSVDMDNRDLPYLIL